MAKKAKTKKPGTVRKIVKSYIPGSEKAEIEVHDADDLYREIRIENELVGPEGKPVKLKLGAPVEVTVEADRKDTTPKSDSKSE